ncbi:YdeI/OmpD-associated family protein [Chitinolyticbacter albus]|uniref:YdeI/OmpD-associated family protein n=1 Tax=Chitinolyticbacter albus TaxID=2961951 RepID=UPI00210A57E7|nr:YdeI/OmpD-associated family protein [Chitinolyticbacter albus]
MSDPTLTFANQAEWESWLELNGSLATGVWLRLAKKGAEQPTVCYAEALESALCHGWIDGQKQAESEQYWLQRFTPRAARSIWSKINKAKAEALITAGRMHPAGLREIDRAKIDGRWDAAYSSASTSVIPEDLQKALDANQTAKAFFATLNSQNRYAILFRIQNVKKAETRAKKIAQFIDMLANGEKLYP